jgi:hypothetical protein
VVALASDALFVVEEEDDEGVTLHSASIFFRLFVLDKELVLFSDLVTLAGTPFKQNFKAVKVNFPCNEA